MLQMPKADAPPPAGSTATRMWLVLLLSLWWMALRVISTPGRLNSSLMSVAWKAFVFESAPTPIDSRKLEHEHGTENGQQQSTQKLGKQL